MKSNRNDDAATWLRSLGYDPEPEPTWVSSGRKPDFFARSTDPLWAEVKTLDAPDEAQDFDWAWNDLHRRCEKSSDLVGILYVLIGTAYDEKTGKSAIAHVRRICDKSDAPSTQVVLIPREPDYARTVKLTYRSADGDEVVQRGPASTSTRYGFHPSHPPSNWADRIHVEVTPGEHFSVEAYDALEGNGEPQLILLWEPSAKPLRIMGGSGEAQWNRTMGRVRGAISDACNQLKNGQRFHEAPGLVLIYQDDFSALGDEQFFAALFGDLTYQISLSSPSVLGPPHFGANAVLQPDLNTSVSAVRYVRRGGAIAVINPYARFRVDIDAIGEPVWMFERDKLVRRR
jgi:hypothetical protein